MAAAPVRYVSVFEMIMRRIGVFDRPHGEGSALRVGVRHEPVEWATVHVGARVHRWYGCKPLYIKGNNKQPEAALLFGDRWLFWTWVSRWRRELRVREGNIPARSHMD